MKPTVGFIDWIDKSDRRFHRLAWLALALLAGCGGEEPYPSRPITIVVPWAPGGGTDSTARAMAPLLERELGVPVNVENATGGEGVTGHTKGARAKPDGATLTLLTVEINMLHWRGLTGLTYRDFSPCVLFNRDAAAVFVREDSPWKTLKEVEAEVRRVPGQVKAAGTARGAIWHLALAGWMLRAGLKPADVNWLSIGGAGPSLQQLVSGGVDLVCCSLPEAKVIGAKARCLGVMSEARHPDFPDVPTFREQGVDWVLTGWRGVALPKGTPAGVTRRVVEAVERVVKGEAFGSFMRRGSFDVRCETPGEFAVTLAQVESELGKLLTSPEFRQMAPPRVGAMFFPAALTIALAAVIIALLIKGGFRRQAAAAPAGSARRAVEVVLGVALLIALEPVAGFIGTAGVLLFALLWRCGARPWVAAAVAASVVPLSFWIFAEKLGVSLSRGPLGL